MLRAGLPLRLRRRRLVTRSQPWEHRAPGYRERPPRSGLGRVERDNPVGVQALPGRPTVREVELPGGRRMVQQANAGCVERRQETNTCGCSLRVAVSDNWPDTGMCSARKGADVDQVSH
jgi:hypothetical protein